VLLLIWRAAQGSLIWGQTLRFADEEGGTVRIAQPGIMFEPWNPSPARTDL
jgi:hypothetical protein